MNVNNNKYTFIFAKRKVVVVGYALAFAATFFAGRKEINHRAEKMQDIINAIGLKTVEQDGEEVFLSRDLAELNYEKYIVEELSLRSDGSVDESVKAFDVNLGQELKKPVEEQIFPL